MGVEATTGTYVLSIEMRRLQRRVNDLIHEISDKELA